MAASWGGRYTRYADDLAFSAGRSWQTGTSRILDLVEQVVRDEGFRLNQRKTAVLPRAGRQLLGGLVVNQHPRVAWVAQHDPARGARLRAQLDAIDWNG